MEVRKRHKQQVFLKQPAGSQAPNEASGLSCCQLVVAGIARHTEDWPCAGLPQEGLQKTAATGLFSHENAIVIVLYALSL